MNPKTTIMLGAKRMLALGLLWLVAFGSPPAYAQNAPMSAATAVRTLNATVGKSTVLRLSSPASRVAIADPNIADVVLLGPREVYVLGKAVGTTNLTTWGQAGGAQPIDV